MIKTLNVLLLSILSSLTLLGADIDSLYVKWQNESGGGRVSLGNTLLKEGAEQGFIQEGLTFKRTQTIESEAYIYYMMSYRYYASDRFDDALSTALMALPLCEKTDDKELLAECINMIGIVYQRKGFFGQAITYMERVYRLDLASNDKSGMSSTMNNLATLYLATDQPETALSYVLPAIDIERESGDRQRLAVRLGLASDIWLEMGHLENALNCVEEAYRLDKEDHRESKAAIRLSQKASVLIAMEKDIEAEICLTEAIPILEKNNNITSLAICHNQLGQLYYKESLYKQAEKTYRIASEYATKAGSDYVKKKSLSGLWLCQKYLGKLEDALKTLEDYTQLSEKIADDRADSAVEDFKIRYETKEKEDALALEKRMSRTRLIGMIGLGILCALLITLLSICWKMLRIRRRQARILNKNIEVKSQLLSMVQVLDNKNDSNTLKKIINDIDNLEDVPKITSREMDVIKWCCEGLSSKEIADKLNVSVRTIDAHKGNIFKKLNLSSTVEHVRYAAKVGMFKK